MAPEPAQLPTGQPEPARKVKLVCGTHKNSFVITLGFQYDEAVERPTSCEALVTSRNVRRCQRPAKFRVWESTFPHPQRGSAPATAATEVVASNGFVVWAPTLAPDPARPDCPRHAFGDPDDSCTCPEATEVDRADCVEKGLHDAATTAGYCKSCGAH